MIGRKTEKTLHGEAMTETSHEECQCREKQVIQEIGFLIEMYTIVAYIVNCQNQTLIVKNENDYYLHLQIHKIHYQTLLIDHQ